MPLTDSRLQTFLEFYQTTSNLDASGLVSIYWFYLLSPSYTAFIRPERLQKLLANWQTVIDYTSALSLHSRAVHFPSLLFERTSRPVWSRRLIWIEVALGARFVHFPIKREHINPQTETIVIRYSAFAGAIFRLGRTKPSDWVRHDHVIYGLNHVTSGSGALKAIFDDRLRGWRSLKDYCNIRAKIASFNVGLFEMPGNSCAYVCACACVRVRMCAAFIWSMALYYALYWFEKDQIGITNH